MRQVVDRQELATQLQKLHEREGLADEGKIERDAPLLMMLADRVLAAEGVEERPLIPTAIRLLTDALQSLAPDSRQLLSAGLNMDRVSGVTLQQRLRRLADERHISDLRHLADRERNLYLPLADFVLEEVAVARARRAHEGMALGDGDQAAAALFVANQFKYYYRIFTPMGAVGSDLTAYLAWRARVPEGPWPDSIIDAAIWHYAQWEFELERFIQDLGGNWIASQPQVEADLVHTLDVARRRLPFSDWDASALCLALSVIPHQQRLLLEERLQAQGLQEVYRARLRTWVLRCDCNLRRPKKSCEPHQVIQATRQFMILVDREWYRLAQWYQIPGSSNLTGVEPSRLRFTVASKPRSRGHSVR